MVDVKLYLLIIIGLFVQNNMMAQKKYSFRGKLGQSISFRLDLEQNKSGIVAGETTYYRRNGEIAKLPVYGIATSAEGGVCANGNSLWLTEYDGTKQCGHFDINLSNGVVKSGTWVLIDKELKINSIEKTIFPTGKTFFHPAKGTDISGDYSFTYSRGEGLDDCGGSCTLTYKNGKVHYNICTVTPNIAEEEKSATLQGSYFTGAHGAYRYKGYIDRNFVYVWATSYGQVDDWGAHATIGGCYVRKK